MATFKCGDQAVDMTDESVFGEPIDVVRHSKSKIVFVTSTDYYLIFYGKFEYSSYKDLMNSPCHRWEVRIGSEDGPIYFKVTDFNMKLKDLDKLGNGNDKIFGSPEGDVLEGVGGNDFIRSMEGDDRLLGGSGQDTLDGGEGADRLEGGKGNDVYIDVSADDTLIEKPGGGVDTVKTSLGSFVVPLNIERLIYTGDGDFNATGNELRNLITGGAGNDTIDGAAGRDELRGGLGDDSYIVDHSGDKIVEKDGGGTDEALSGVSYTLPEFVERLRLQGDAPISGTGNKLGNEILGNESDNVLSGGRGSDTLEGGGGADTLQGGKGPDVFRFGDIGDSPASPAPDGLMDNIRDFQSGTDKIDLSGIDIDGDGDTAEVELSWMGDAAFTGSTGEVRFAAGRLEIDSNGDAAADFALSLSHVTSLDPGDLLL